MQNKAAKKPSGEETRPFRIQLKTPEPVSTQMTTKHF